jgi:hypothetical protein
MDLPIPFDANGLETVSMALQNRMMTLVAFLQAQNCSNLPGSWRHPATMLDFLTPEYYQRIARTLEDGKIQMAFLDDRLALPDIYTGHHAEAIGAGVRAVKLDPCTIMMAMGMVTQRLGRATYSTTYYEPYHVARVFATMDLMLKGRAAAEHRDLALQRRGQELRPRRTHGTRRPLTPGGRVHGCGPWPLEHLGRRCADPRQGEQPLCRFGKGAPAGSRGTLFSIARPIQRAALAARASRAHPGGSIRPRPVFCREVGRPGVCDLPRAAGWDQGIRHLQGRRRQPPACE